MFDPNVVSVALLFCACFGCFLSPCRAIFGAAVVVVKRRFLPFIKSNNMFCMKCKQIVRTEVFLLCCVAGPHCNWYLCFLFLKSIHLQLNWHVSKRQHGIGYRCAGEMAKHASTLWTQFRIETVEQVLIRVLNLVFVFSCPLRLCSRFAFCFCVNRSMK